MVSIETIREQFDELGIEPSDEVVNKCIEICINNNITDPVEFVEQWMAYSVSKLSGAEPTVAYLNEMEAHEYTSKARKASKLSGIVAAAGNIGASPRMDTKVTKITTYRNVDSVVEQDVLEMYGCVTPKNKKSVSRSLHNVNTSDSVRGAGSPFTTVTYSPISAAAAKKNDPNVPSKAGQVVYTYGNAKLLKQFNWLPTTTTTVDGESSSKNDDSVSIDDHARNNRRTAGSGPPGRRGTGVSFTMKATQFANDGCKYMFDSSYDRVMILGDRIYECGNAICNRLALDAKQSRQKQQQLMREKADSLNNQTDSTAVDVPLTVKKEPTEEVEEEVEQHDDENAVNVMDEEKYCSWFDGVKVHHVDYPSSEPIRVLGRIVAESSLTDTSSAASIANGTASSDNDATSSKRNLANASKLSIVDYDEHTLRYTRLDLSRVQAPPGWSLFPGQAVLLEGVNPRGILFTVNQIHCERTLAFPRAPASLDKTLTIVIASAPFTDSDDLLYEKLSSLLLYCNNNPPDVLILTGPFADANCKLYADVAETFDEYFEKIVATIMNSIGEQTQVFIVANHNDLVSACVYPTPPYKVASFYKNLHFLPDPCVFSVEGLEIATTTVDIIKQLIDSECTAAHIPMAGGGSAAAAPLVGGDKIKRAYSHLFHQTSFYPLNPPPEDVPLDVDMLNEFGRLQRVPNVMICPSALNRYVREINGCVCINPGFVDGHSADGSYARLVIQPPETNDATFNATPASYIACQIVKT
ncbi:DNA polymerase alpha subunit B [Anopheles maculipalpis]|uniref:DNA polymerase alpha subunit B n=1 Tax=Anopheles maculipalpis TaxID=1496333 RepID=UPI002158C3D3|nr:DNA polymerase alpha subunit B [Anopheles maculipalpis]